MDANVVAGEAFIAPLPECPVHGRMKSRDDGWACVGWDGEGCDHEAPPMELTPLGHIGSTGNQANRKYLNQCRGAPDLPT